MGSSQSVHMANNSGQKIWVLIALKPEWLAVDVFVDVALLFVAVGEIKAITQAAELPEEIVTIADLFKFMRIAVQLLSATVTAGTRPADAVLSMIEAFKGVSSAVDIGTAPDVSDTSFLDYLNADGIASIFGAKTLNAMVMSDDGKQLAWLDGGPDDSWIVTSRQEIVRSKYGTLCQEDPSAGEADWSVPS
ncbi:hypothetical protein AB1N83_013348 [Pleurotus pulmonarius]|nr:hypothetical protein EYR38_001965 [Pleurotus pulmonarius]